MPDRSHSAISHGTIAESPLYELIAPFAHADDRRAGFQLVTTVLLFITGWSAMALAVRLAWNYGVVLPG